MRVRQRLIAVLLVICLLSINIYSFSHAESLYDAEINNMTVNYLVNPIGIENNSSPRFSWALVSNLAGNVQRSYEIDVRTGSSDGESVWSSGEVESSISTSIPYAGVQLEEETSYYWRVTIEDTTGAVITSEWSTFETGTDWADSDWIIPTAENGVAPLLRTEKTLDSSNIVSARLYITSLGIYSAYINGSKIQGTNSAGDSVNSMFAPGWTDYNDYVNYQTYDITNLISEDQIALGVILGNGWYGGKIGLIRSGFGANVSYEALYNDAIGDADNSELALLAKVAITYSDGTREVIGSSSAEWTSNPISPYVSNDYFDGEVFNSSIAASLAGWNDIQYDDSEWLPVVAGEYRGEIRADNSAVPYVADQYSLEPISAYSYFDDEIIAPENSDFEKGEIVSRAKSINEPISLAADEKLIVDFGQNMVGVASLTIQGTDNSTVTIRHAEMINDGKINPDVAAGGSDGPRGTLYRTALKGAANIDQYIIHGAEEQSYQPEFTYHGFRYIEISSDAPVTIMSVQGKVITSVAEQTGNLQTSDLNINKLFNNVLWGQIGNFNSVPTDCPQRDERAGWTGDAQLFSATALYNFNVRAYFENYTDIMRETAAANDGMYLSVMPEAYVKDSTMTLGSGWSDAGVIIPWNLYQNTGDISYIEDSYEAIKAYLEVVRARGYSTERFGDWLSPAAASIPYMNSVYQIYTTKLAQNMAQIMGVTDDVEMYSNYLDNYITAYRLKYLDAEGNVLSSTADDITQYGRPQNNIVIDNSQTALLWALKLELYENEEQKQVMIDNLLANIANEGGVIRPDQEENTLSVGFLGVNVLLPVLTDIGMADVAYDLLFQDAMPSWLYSVKNGATTIWERWNSYSVENSFGDSGMNSFNHYSYGAVVEWMMGYMSGIIQDQENPGYQNFILQPTIDESGRITYVNGSYKSLYGTIESNWTAQSGNLKNYSAVVPANTSAELYLPISDNDISISNTSTESTLKASSFDDLETIEGVKYIGLVEKNGVMTAKFELVAGGYEFVVETDGTLTIELAEGYIPLSSLNPEPTPVPSEPTDTTTEPTTAPTTDENTSDTTTETTTDGEDVPKTGDELPYAALALTLVAVLAGGGIVLLRKSHKKENTQQDE